MKIAQYSIRHQAVVGLLLLLITAGGLVAYNHLGKLEDPEFAIKTAIINTPYPGASPYEVEQLVTEVIERAAQSANEIKHIRSISRAGISTVYVDILDHNRAKELQQLWDMLRRKVTAAQGSLPEGAGPSQVLDDYGDVYGIFLALTGDGFSNAELKTYADYIQRELLLVKDVSRIMVFGARTQCVNVDISVAKAAALGIHPNGIAAALRSQNLEVDPAAIQTTDRRIRVEYPGQFQSVDQIGDLVIGGQGEDKIRLRDIAKVSRGYVEPPEPTMRFNGKPAVAIAISAASGANVVTMGDAIQARLDELFQDLPLGLDIKGVYYQSEFVKGAIGKFISNLLESVGIVIIVLLIAMGIRSGLLIASGLIFSILATLIVMLVWGIDLQRVSIASLILVMGMIVDNAIVVTDGSLVRLKLGHDRERAAVRPAVRTAWPLLGATVIACLAFFPIFMAPDNSGEYCRSLFQVVSIALVASWVLSMTQTPVFCLRFLKPPKDNGNKDPYASWPYRAYKATLTWFLHHRIFSLALMLLLCGLAGYGMKIVPKMFFADSDKAQFFIDYWLPEGARAEQVSSDLEKMEGFLASLPEVKNFTTVIGNGPPRFASNLIPESPNPAFGQVIVNVHDYLKIPALQARLDKWMAEHLPDADPKLRSYINGPPSDYKVEPRFSGPDPLVLRRLARKAVEILRTDPMATYIRNDWRERVPVWQPVYSQQRARDAGVERRDVALAILGATDGTIVSTLREGDEQIPIRMRTLQPDGARVPSPESTPVWGTGPGTVPLGQVVDDSGISWEDPIVRRYDRRRAITVKCDTNGVTPDTLLARVRPKIEAIALPAGYNLGWAGDYELAQEGNAGVQKFMPLALLLMFFILVVMFNGFRQPVIIVLVVPLALTGMVVGLLVTGHSFGFLALLGAYSLVGMLIKNAVVLIDEIEFTIKREKAPYDAVVESSVSRLRPVTMASATTIFGMTPLLTDAMFASMAVAIMFGLAFATVLTLVVVPVLYTLFFRIRTAVPASNH